MRLGGAGLCAAIAILGAALPVPARADQPAQAAKDKGAAAKDQAAPKDKGASKEQAADDIDTKPPRPPLIDVPSPRRLPWEQHLEVGGGFAITATPVSRDGERNPTSVRLRPGPGFHIRLSWEVLRKYLWFTGYVTESSHPLSLPAGALGLSTKLTEDSAWMYTFGARLSPTFPLGDRVRIWGTAGAGWGQVRYPRLCPKQPCDGVLMVRERAASVLEIPVGFGAAVELIPRWLRIHAELTVSLLPGQTGPALDRTQAIDAAGKIVDVLPMPRLDSIITQTIGLSLVL
ncbi:Hypothetical protein A7982_07738 [Minicystis rosea]|nr:Hypothetical protein A7982_07738 [Minicystis rosea]